jgi:trehalose 6-phosphate phosphatase
MSPADVVAAIAADPAGAVLALDVDGTLSPIVERPGDARLAPGARDALAALTGHLAAVALISGRAAGDVVRLGDLEGLAGLRVLGHYGLERWLDGQLDSPRPVPGVATARARLAALVRAAPAGVSVEDKRHSLVVHTRPAAHPQQALDDLEPTLRRIAADTDLEVVPGRYVIELRPAGIDKGGALRQVVEEVQARVVVYAGDDLGDLPAFAAVAELRAAGDVTGFTVASSDAGHAEAPRELRERADVVLDGPVAVVELLSAVLAAVTQG